MSTDKYYRTLFTLGCLSVGAMSVPALAADPVEGSPPGAASEPESTTLDEIIVTSTRRAEHLSDVPLSIVAVDRQSLDKQGIRSADDLMRLTPSVTFGQGGQFYGTGQSNISIRGVQSTSGTPTTGVYIDDTPIQTRTGISPSLTNAYPKIFDLARVEILRGPQGTLFGTGSMGGAVRFITPDPNLVESSFYSRSEFGSTDNGDISYELGVAGGAPLIEDKLGFRASFWHRREGGYVDRLDRLSKEVVQRDMGAERSNVGRIALGWKPLENVTITPSVFFQDSKIDDSSLVEVSQSDFEGSDLRTSLYRLPQLNEDRFWLPAVKVNVEFDHFSLISNTSYFTRKTHTVSDDTALNLAIWSAYDGPFPPADFEDVFGEWDAASQNHTSQLNFTQELRLQSNEKGRLNWVVGAFFARSTTRDEFGGENTQLLENLNYGQALIGEPPFSSVEEALGASLYQGRYVIFQRSRYYDKQKSVFAQVDYEVLPRLTLTAGLRYTDALFELSNFNAGVLNASGPDGTLTEVESENRPVTPKFGVSFKATDNNLFYANAAKGVRGGGAAEPAGSRCVDDADAIGFDPMATRNILPDSVWSYEVGSKNSLAGGRFAIDASAYRLIWKDLQTNLFLPICQVNTTLNLGEAQVDGVDLALTARVLDGLTLGASVSYMDARYTSALPGPDDTIIRREDEPLDVAPWSMHFDAEYSLSVNARDFYARADYTRTTHDDTPVDAGSPLVDPAIPRIPRTTSLDLRAGVRFGGIDISLFANNLTNEQPMLSLGRDPPGENFRTTTFRPRTIGITATFRK